MRMNPDESAPAIPPAEDRIDAICDSFEEAWQSGVRPNLAEYASRGDEAFRPSLVGELLLVELEYRRRMGEQPQREELLQQFPQFAEQIEAIDFKHGWVSRRSQSTVATTPALDRTLFPGFRIAQFDLVARLGAGAAGEVWQARDSRLQRNVAIKIPRAEQLSDEELHRFLREGRAAAQLRHPNIVPVHEVGREGDTAYIVSDLIAGESLRQHLNKGARRTSGPRSWVRSWPRRSTMRTSMEWCTAI